MGWGAKKAGEERGLECGGVGSIRRACPWRKGFRPPGICEAKSLYIFRNVSALNEEAHQARISSRLGQISRR